MKYVLTENYKEIDQYRNCEWVKVKCYQIKAVARFNNVEVGDLGGFIEKIENLI